MPDENYGLSDQHIIFCNEYLIDLNGTQAYIRAGYSPNGACQSASALLTNPNIRAYIQNKMDERSKNTMVDANFVIENLKDVANRCRQAAPVMKFNFATQMMEQVCDENGNGVWEFDGQSANKALELLGKHLGVFEKDNRQKGGETPNEAIMNAIADRLNIPKTNP